MPSTSESHNVYKFTIRENSSSWEISHFIQTRKQSQDRIHPEWALTIRIIILVTIGCIVDLPTTMKLPFFITLHKCLQHWHLRLLLWVRFGTVQLPKLIFVTSVGAVRAASTLCLARIVEMSFLTFASFFWDFVNLLGITCHQFNFLG